MKDFWEVAYRPFSHPPRVTVRGEIFLNEGYAILLVESESGEKLPLAVEDKQLFDRFLAAGVPVQMGGIYLFASPCELEADYNGKLTNVGRMTVSADNQDFQI